MDDLRPDIPANCADRPVVGGLVQPYVNVRLAAGGVDFRSADNQRYERCWREGLCQTCGWPLTELAVFFGGPNQLARRQFDEPPVCTPCAAYASRACPMLAGRRTTYASGPAPADGARGKVCSEPGCDCTGWIETVRGDNAGGAPAHSWYAAYVRTGGWVLTGEEQTVTVEGRTVTRTVINGGLLTVEPRKVMLVSEPGRGRVWQRIPTPPQDPDACGVAKPPEGTTCEATTCPVSAS